MTSKFKHRGAAQRALPSGFTLVETMVAITVLMLALVGPLSIIQKGIQATTISKDQDTAFYLAQDAVEYVRWARDTNDLSFPIPDGAQWLAGGSVNGSTATVLSPACTGTNGCYLDSLNQYPAVPTACSASLCAGTTLNYDSLNNRFTYAPTSASVKPTIFTRAINISTPVGGNAGEASVTVKVSWCDQASVCSVTPRSITVREDIFNWQ